MGADGSLGVASDALDLFACPFHLRARAIDSCLVRQVGDVQVSRPWESGQGCRLDDNALARLVDADRIGKFQMVDPAVHAIDHEIVSLAHFVAGHTLADDRLGGLAAMFWFAPRSSARP
jgi:hypothetical protein